MVGTGRFELPTPRTPSECSTRLSHVPTAGTRAGRGWGNRNFTLAGEGLAGSWLRKRKVKLFRFRGVRCFVGRLMNASGWLRRLCLFFSGVAGVGDAANRVCTGRLLFFEYRELDFFLYRVNAVYDHTNGLPETVGFAGSL